jgi:hypothetical protein
VIAGSSGGGGVGRGGLTRRFWGSRLALGVGGWVLGRLCLEEVRARDVGLHLCVELEGKGV